MGVHFVQLGDETLIDLRNDSVTPETLAEGVTAHDKSGNRIIGTMSLLNNHDITLGVHTDGLLYIFIDGVPTGNGVSMPDKVGDVYGNVDSGNNIVLQGALADGTYSVKYEMENGETVNIGNLVLDTNVYYSVTKSLSYCSIDNSATSVIEGEPYSATISANEGYELKSVTVTMGGSPVTVTNGVINIASVTGDIVITAVAEEVVVEPEGNNLFNKDTATYNARLGSDCTVRTGVNGALVTDFIDITNINKLKIEGTFVENTVNTSVHYGKLAIYDADGNWVQNNGAVAFDFNPNGWEWNAASAKSRWTNAAKIKVCLSITASTAITAADVTDVKILVVE